MQKRVMSDRNMKIATGVIAGTVTAATLGIAIAASTRKPKSKFQKNTARTLNTISAVTHSLANMMN